MRSVLLHLFFAGLMMAEGGVTAFGKRVETSDPARMLVAIRDGYAARHGLVPTEEELTPLRRKFGIDGGKVRQFDFPYEIALSWKLNRVWWGKHGGRLVLSAFGIHLATDGMLKEVEAMEKTGEVRFADRGSRETFFAFYDGYRGDGVTRGERAREILLEGPLQSDSRN